jgi:hypothetical protein
MNKVHFQDLQDWLYLVEPECRQREMKTLRAPLLLLKERAALTPTRTEMDIHFPQSQTVCDDVPYLLRMLASTQESKIASRINPRDREWCTMIVKYSRKSGVESKRQRRQRQLSVVDSSLGKIEVWDLQTA